MDIIVTILCFVSILGRKRNSESQKEGTSFCLHECLQLIRLNFTIFQLHL